MDSPEMNAIECPHCGGHEYDVLTDKSVKCKYCDSVWSDKTAVEDELKKVGAGV